MYAKLELSLALSTAECDFLEQNGFNLANFLELQELLSNSQFPPERNLITTPLLPPSLDEFPSLPTTPEDLELGQRAIEQGEVGVLILNGGMATRFGGVGKGTVPVIGATSSGLVPQVT